MNQENKPLWEEAHNALQQALKKEIKLMREILANLHQEELFLVLNDKTSRDQIIEERALLKNKLEKLKKIRIEIFHQLKSFYPSQEEATSESVESLIFPANEENCETLFLRDQHLAIFERINLQSSRNEVLLNLVQNIEKKEGKAPKTKLLTITEEENKEM